MNKYFPKFLKLNKKIIFAHKKINKNILLVDRGKFNAAYLCSLAASIINKEKKMNVIVLTDDKNADMKNFYKSFGVEKFITGFNYVFALKNFLISIYSLILTFKYLIKLKKNNFLWFIDNLKIQNIKIGELIYDTYIRYNQKYINPKIDLEFTNILFKAVFRTLIILKYIKKYSIQIILVGTSCGTNNNGISIKIGAKKKLKVLEPQPNRVRVYNQDSINNGLEEILSFNLKKLMRKKYNIDKINVFLKKRIKGEVKTDYTGTRDIFYSNKKKLFINKNQFLKKLNVKSNNIKKIVLVAPHTFSDFCHGEGMFIFTDYYSHFKLTLEYINKKKFNNILWIVRPHPTGKFYGEKGIAESLVKKYNKKNIKLCPKNLSTDIVLDLCDNVITGRGTIAMEFACKGKYPITAGPSIYSGYGFTIDSKTQNEYFKSIDRIINLPKLTKNQINKAKKILFLLENRNQFRSSQILKDVYGIGRSKQNTKFFKKLHQTEDFFNKNLIDNMKSINPVEDIYFSGLRANLKNLF